MQGGAGLKMQTAEAFIYLWYYLVIGAVRYVADLHFITRFNKKPCGINPILLYLAANYALFVLCYQLNILYLGEVFSLIMVALFSKWMLDIALKNIILPATIVFVLATFLNGFSTVLFFWVSRKIPLPNQLISTLFQIFATGLLLLLLLLGYHLILVKFKYLNIASGSSMFFAVLPSALIIWAVNLLTLPLGQPTANTSQLERAGIFTYFVVLLIMVVAFAAVLAACDRTARIHLQSQEQQLLQRELRIQTQHTKESIKRWEATKAYQHDVRNHLLVLAGLLKADNKEEAIAYLNNLVSAANELVPRVASGSPGLDILLEEKMRFAEEEAIPVTIDFRLPSMEGVNEVDLCILFANAMDNAIAASLNVAVPNRFIGVQVAKRHGFIVIQVKNRAQKISAPIEYGIGLNNIRKIAQKYGGSITTKAEQDSFILSILLVS